MHFTDDDGQRARRWALWRTMGIAGMLAGCTSPMPPYRPAPTPAPTPGAAATPGAVPPAPAATAPPAAAATAPVQAIREARNWNEFRVLAAARMVAANPQMTYTGEVPEILLAIPVLEIELNGDGSIRRIEVLRHPKQAKDTTQLAIDAVRRAAPFGNVSRLPRPWKFSETFLFDDGRRFKPRTLDN